MHPIQSHAFTRRQFLGTGLTLASASLAVPSFLQRSALALPHSWWGGAIPGVDEDRVLVVVQLSGGNDGLNTVVPFGEGAYQRARPGIGLREDRVLKLAKAEVGLHPNMGGIKALYDEGQCAIIQGVGYPNPNRSHFKSMDIWHTADTNGTGDGWLGRYFDSECCGAGKGESGRPENPMSGVAIGGSAPLAMQGRVVMPLSFESAELFRWTGQDVAKDLRDEYDRIARHGVPETGADPESNASFLVRTALDAQISSDLIRKAVAAKPRVTYPGSDLSRQLQMVASMITAGLKTRVYYVSMGGFDTHAQQGGENGRHAQLLGQFSGAIKAFYDDLKSTNNAGRVLTMSFSEFGRRVSQNASQGTDHGTAAPMFFFGPMVQPGVLTDHPSLTDLDAGDLKFTVDFRSAYAGVLERWLGADSKKILEGSFEKAPVVRKA